MLLQINKNVRIVNNDGMNYCPENRTIVPDTTNGKKNKNAGKEVWNRLGYYPNLEFALLAINGSFSSIIEDTEASSIQGMIAQIKKTKEEIIEALSQYSI